MPKIAEIDDTPNPNAVKFTLHEPLSWGVAHAYDNPAQAAGDPLATALFALDHVTNVFYTDRWLTVTQDGEADWPALVRLIAVPLRAAPAAAAQSAELVSAARLAVHTMSEDEQDRFARITDLLDLQIRPALQADGGDLHVLGLSGDTLSIHYQGACGTCPSSIGGTLASIENLLRSIEPDIAVQAV
ncbi:nitrogen-fixing NifU-like protein [Oxalobacteraceae bacterium IMCC9480]|jgi:Fe-S cluster biogenesis protein NfuA|nr:nitrogen-fixing NifU-like protein [Oxalobacteraceae bacterium IMCC9480]NDP59789.1 NifU family protein [Oxalobacteraceae bacterium]